VAHLHLEPPGAARPGSIGQVVPGFEVKVCDDAGRELPHGETGWLWVRGDSRAIGYWQQMEKTAQAFRGEWYVSGDLIRMDDRRIRDLLRPRRRAAQGGGQVARARRGRRLPAFSTRPSSKRGDRRAGRERLVKPRAYVVPRTRQAGLEEELKAFVRARLDAYKHPREVVLVDALPRTHLGKVDRGKLNREAVGS
jgi:acyl-coenzyme A synthetase/AMP-(fatty) acid ligase